MTSVVSAAGFESWKTGRGQYNLKDGRQSADVIKDYASRETPLPAVDEATALIFEDGKVIVMTSNAHRVGAAKLRGQRTIQFKELKVRRVKEQEPSEEASDGLAVLAVASTTSAPEIQAEPVKTMGQQADSYKKSRWQSFVASMSYHRKHRHH